MFSIIKRLYIFLQLLKIELLLVKQLLLLELLLDQYFLTFIYSAHCMNSKVETVNFSNIIANNFYYFVLNDRTSGEIITG